MKKVGFLYDNISRNIGDLAIGKSIKKMLLDGGLSENDFEEMIPGISNAKEYENIIIGGGLLIRSRGDFFYDKFRLKGKYILNCAGIHDNPKDLEYLNEYKYISVRSKNDKKKLNYIQNKINIIPDTTLLLEDIKISIDIKKPSIGIHCFESDNFNEINELIKKYSKDFYIYLLPITHYNYDFEFMAKIKSENLHNNKVVVLPILNPLEIFTIIGKFNFFISYSLHGAYFAYKHNVPFILASNPKMEDFMNDRNLNKFLFHKSSSLDSVFQYLIENRPDYSKKLLTDLKKLDSHQKNIIEIILNKKTTIIQKTKIKISKNENNYYKDNYIFFDKKMKEEIDSLKEKNIELKKDLEKIQSSKTYKVWQNFNKIKKKILNTIEE